MSHGILPAPRPPESAATNAPRRSPPVRAQHIAPAARPRAWLFASRLAAPRRSARPFGRRHRERGGFAHGCVRFVGERVRYPPRERGAGSRPPVRPRQDRSSRHRGAGLLIGGSGIYLLVEGARRLVAPEPAPPREQSRSETMLVVGARDDLRLVVLPGPRREAHGLQGPRGGFDPLPRATSARTSPCSLA